MMKWISVEDKIPDLRHIVKAKTQDMNDDEWLRCCVINGIWEDDTIDFECEEKYPKITHWRNYGVD